VWEVEGKGPRLVEMRVEVVAWSVMMRLDLEAMSVK